MKISNKVLAPLAGLALGLAATGCHPGIDVENVSPEACLAELTSRNKVRIDNEFYATPGEADALKVEADGTYTTEDGITKDRWGIARDFDVVFQDDIDEFVTGDDISEQLFAFAYNPDTVHPLNPDDSWEYEDVWPAQIELAEGYFNNPEDGSFMIAVEPGEAWFENPSDIDFVVTRGCDKVVLAANGDPEHEIFDLSDEQF